MVDSNLQRILRTLVVLMTEGSDYNFALLNELVSDHNIVLEGGRGRKTVRARLLVQGPDHVIEKLLAIGWHLGEQNGFDTSLEQVWDADDDETRVDIAKALTETLREGFSVYAVDDLQIGIDVFGSFGAREQMPWKRFCPLAAHDCRVHRCVMWNDESCAFAQYFQLVVATLKQKEAQESRQMEEALRRRSEMERQEKDFEVPKEFLAASVEELAQELYELAKQHRIESDTTGPVIHRVLSLFWERKGVDDYRMPQEIRLKKSKVAEYAQYLRSEDRDKERENALTQERDALPELVTECVEWARSKSMRRVTKADLEIYMLDSGIELQPETTRMLYLQVNQKLGSR